MRPKSRMTNVVLIRGRSTKGRSSMTDVRNVVLVHGGFVDGSGWQGVYDLLKADGFNVSVVQNQTLSLDSDVETTHNVLELLDEPAILVGHSYGGAVISEAGCHERVAGLVYIAAFAPDAGESVNTLIADPPPGAPVPPILPPSDGFLFLDRDKFAASFAADLPARQAEFMADSQVPWGVEALGGEVSEPAWRSKPSWYLVASADRMIPPQAQRAMAERIGATVVEATGSHAIYVSQPQAVAELIKQAAERAVSEPASAVGCPLAYRPAGPLGSCRPTDSTAQEVDPSSAARKRPRRGRGWFQGSRDRRRSTDPQEQKTPPERGVVTKPSIGLEPMTPSLPWKTSAVVMSPSVREVRCTLDMTDMMALPGRQGGTQTGPISCRPSFVALASYASDYGFQGVSTPTE